MQPPPLLVFLAGSKIEQPSMFIAGAEDAVITTYRAYRRTWNRPRLASKPLLAGAGHWVQQDAPEAGNASLAEFLAKGPMVRRAV